MPLLPLLALLAACEPAAPPVPLAEQDPTAQLAAIEAALAQDPQEALRRCAEVTAAPARQRCERIQTRPHLWQRPPEAMALEQAFLQAIAQADNALLEGSILRLRRGDTALVELMRPTFR